MQAALITAQSQSVARVGLFSAFRLGRGIDVFIGSRSVGYVSRSGSIPTNTIMRSFAYRITGESDGRCRNSSTKSSSRITRHLAFASAANAPSSSRLLPPAAPASTGTTTRRRVFSSSSSSSSSLSSSSSSPSSLPSSASLPPSSPPHPLLVPAEVARLKTLAEMEEGIEEGKKAKGWKACKELGMRYLTCT